MRLFLAAMAAALIASGTSAALDEFEGDAYPLNTCPVSGEELGSMGDPVQVVLDGGRDVRLCCAGCTKRIEADPAKYIAKIDEAIEAQQTPAYPVDTCVVSGESLDSMGGAISRVHNNRLVQFCCSGCTKKFDADPATYIAKLDEATKAAQMETYPFELCMISGHKLDGSHGEPIDLVAGGTLVRLCCSGCVSKFNAHPAKYLEMIASGEMDESAAEGSDHK